MLRRWAFLSVAVVMPAVAWPGQILDYLTSILKAQSQNPIPVAVSAVAEVEGGEPLLKFHVTNISKEVLTFEVDRLPWGHPDSVTYQVLTMDGTVLPNRAVFYNVIGDTSDISLAPGKSLDGAYNLLLHLNEKSVPRDADLLVVWAWRVRTGEEGKVDRGVATGVAWVHTPKWSFDDARHFGGTSNNRWRGP